MPKYMVQAALSADALKGTLAEGGTAREAAVRAAIESLGGSLEVFYYAFGDADVVGIADMPDNVSAAAFAVTVASAGVGSVHTTVLLTPAEIDAMAKKTARYRPPGG
jgi:uncharacterized protein with GYD domain